MFRRGFVGAGSQGPSEKVVHKSFSLQPDSSGLNYVFTSPKGQQEIKESLSNKESLSLL